MRAVACMLVLLLPGLPAPAEARLFGLLAGDGPTELTVAAPLLHLRTGPGRGYPVLYSAEQGEVLAVEKQRTRWVKLRAANGAMGWSTLEALAGAVAERVPVATDGRFGARRGQLGFATGDFGGAATISAWGSLALGPHVALRATGTQVLGRHSDGVMGTGDVVLRPFPQWRVSPWLAIGGGALRIDPQTTLVASADREHLLARAGAGVEIHLTRRFVLHTEVMDTVLFTNRDDNEEVLSWHVGFSAFF